MSVIVSNTSRMSDSGECRAPKLFGFLPAQGSKAEERLTALANARTFAQRTLYGAEPEAIAAGVWLLRGGGLGRHMNVYLIEDEGGGDRVRRRVSRQMSCNDPRGGRALRGYPPDRARSRRLRPPRRRGRAQRPSTAIRLRGDLAAETATPYRDYWNLSLLSAWARPIYPRLLASWDGGALSIAGTLEEGDEVAGFRVLHMPGHAPGLICLHREEDGVALVSDLLYTLNPETGFGNAAHVPHPAFNLDTNQAREAIRRMAAIGPERSCGPGTAKQGIRR